MYLGNLTQLHSAGNLDTTARFNKRKTIRLKLR